MTRQTINLLGGLAVVAILVVGLLLGALPHWHEAEDLGRQRDAVESANQSREMLVEAYARQRPDLPDLQAQVTALKQQIATGPHLEQVIALASGLPAGAVLRSIGDDREQTATTTPPATTGATGTSAVGFTSLPVTIVVDVRKAGDAATVLDKLRAGPRLLVIDRATLAAAGSTAPDAASFTLTVKARVLARQEAGTS